MTSEVPGSVHINQASDLAEGEELGYPHDRILGLLPSEEAAWSLVERLRGIGIEDGQIELFMGDEGAKLLHSHHGQTGFRRLLVAARRALGDEELHSRRYEEAVQAGNVLVAVQIPESEKDQVAEAMKSDGAFRVRYYGRMLIEDMI